MTRYDFDRGWEVLCEVYEKNPKKSLTDLIYNEIQRWDTQAWQRAIQRFKDDAERVTLPKLGQIKAMLGQVSMDLPKPESSRPACQAGCDRGEVNYRAGEYSFVGTCMACKGGPVGWPKVNPVTFELA